MFQYAIEMANEKLLAEEKFRLEGEAIEIDFGNELNISRSLCALLEVWLADDIALVIQCCLRMIFCNFFFYDRYRKVYRQLLGPAMKNQLYTLGIFVIHSKFHSLIYVMMSIRPFQS